jgi:transposase
MKTRKFVLGNEDEGKTLIGKQDRWQEDIFVACRLSELVPEDHVLKGVNKVLDLSWLRDEVKDLYDEDNGRPGIDPEAAVRLMLAGLYAGITEDRKLMREAQVNIAMRWFAGYRLDERLPDHSSLTRIRQRWGKERFRKIFLRTVAACQEKGLISAETVHIDATLIRADVSWKSLTERHVEKVLEENAGDQEQPAGRTQRKAGRTGRKAQKAKKYSPTDPEATMATSSHNYHLEPSYKAHTAVDDKAGVIVDVEVTTGQTSEGKELLGQLERVEQATGTKPTVVTADSGYAHSCNYAALEDMKIEALIPPQRERSKCAKIPARRFKYNAGHDIVKCPCGKTLRRASEGKNGWVYRASASDCGNCAFRQRCVSGTARTRSVLIVDGYEALLRARRRRHKWREREKALYNRHRFLAEGCHAEGKTRHGMRRAVRRGLANVAIQVYLVSAVMNLKRLAAAVAAALLRSLTRILREVIGRLGQLRAIRSDSRANRSPVILAA